MKYSDMYVLLPRMQFFAFHGVLPQEQVVGAYYYVSLKVKTNFVQAIETDDLNATLNYAELYNTVKHEMQITSKLLEHVAGRIAQALLTNHPGITQAEVKLFKENPPMGADCNEAGVPMTPTP